MCCIAVSALYHYSNPENHSESHVSGSKSTASILLVLGCMWGGGTAAIVRWQGPAQGLLLCKSKCTTFFWTTLLDTSRLLMESRELPQGPLPLRRWVRDCSTCVLVHAWKVWARVKRSPDEQSICWKIKTHWRMGSRTVTISYLYWFPPNMGTGNRHYTIEMWYQTYEWKSMQSGFCSIEKRSPVRHSVPLHFVCV